MVIAVALITGLVYQFNSAFASFAKNYFGEYLACLIETGELPNLGAPTSADCDASFERFTFAAGRPARSGGANRSASARTGKPRSEQAADGEGARGSSSRPAGRVARTSVATDSFGSNSGRSAEKERAGYTGSGASSSRGTSGAYDEVAGRENRQLATASETAQMVGAQKDKQQKTKMSPMSNDPLRDKRAKVKLEPKREVAAEEDSFSIGDFLRYLLIIGIILAIVIFVGGQVLQVSKEWD